MGVDIGGTFTDVVLEAGDTRFSTKVLTTYHAPEDAIIDGMHPRSGSWHQTSRDGRSGPGSTAARLR